MTPTPDDELHANVVEELQAEPAVRKSRIYVRARGGTVTISGQVGTFAERCSIDGAIARVPGIHALDMQVSVSQSAIRRAEGDGPAEPAPVREPNF